jgi:2'-5' RNA ligase
MSADPKQRLFVGVELPGEARAAIEELCRPIRGIGGVRWAPTENLHLTLAFLGWVQPDGIDAIEERLAGAAAETAPLSTRLTGLGRFPERGKARVLWVGLEDAAGSLAELAGRVLGSLGDLFEPEGRAFRAHVTVARARPPIAVHVPDAVPSPAIEVPIVAITLFRSHLGRAHPRYEVLRRWRLGAQPFAIP